MSKHNNNLDDIINQGYEYGFVTDIASDQLKPGLNEDVIRLISAKKKEPTFLLEWRLKAYRRWLTLKPPTWSTLKIAPIDYQRISYYAAPKPSKTLNSLNEVDPELLKTYEKLGILLEVQ
jgi:Fe-S cluster assembly protein SufB